MPEYFKEYVDLVCQQLRWKKARAVVEREIWVHLCDQRDALIKTGMDEDTAALESIRQMGDAVEIGMKLDRVHRPKPQWSMLAATVVLLMIGLLIQLLIFNDDGSGLLSSRLLYTVIGIIVMLIAYLSDFTLLGKYPKTVFFSVAVISIVSLYLSPTFNGQSFYTKYLSLLFPLSFAMLIFALRNKGYMGIILSGLAFAFLASVMITIPSMSGFMVFAPAGIMLLVVAVYRKWFGVKRMQGILLLLILIALLVAILFVYVGIDTYRWNRLSIALNSSHDPLGMGYLGTMTRELLSGASLLGIGNISELYHYISANLFRTDLILTAVVSSFGWIAFAGIIIVMLFFLIKGFSLCFKQKSSLGLFVSLSIMVTFTMQMLSYVIFNLGFQLLSPLSLPLISYGNIATLINLGLTGIMLSVFRTGDIIKDDKALLKKISFFLGTMAN